MLLNEYTSRLVSNFQFLTVLKMSYAVELYIYDLTQGMASSMAPMLGLNFNLEGVWHTAIVVHGKEW